MITLAGRIRGDPTHLARYSDESSPDSRKTGHRKVPIYAVLPSEAPLGWYHDLVARFPEAPGEVKSNRILAGFEALEETVQKRIWRGLRDARIHVFDPGPYLDYLDEAYMEANDRRIPYAELKDRARRGDHLARWFLKQRDETAGRMMLFESVTYQVYGAVGEAITRSMILPSREPPLPEELMNGWLNELQRGHASILRQASEFAAKGSAAFSDALELSQTDCGEGAWRMFWTGPDSNDLIFRGTLRALEDGHGFDKGDAKLLRSLEKERREMVDHLIQTSFYALEPRDDSPDAFIEVESKAEAAVRAADLAAGLASNVYAREGLTGLVMRWQTVYFNGIRVNENNLEAVCRAWRHSFGS